MRLSSILLEEHSYRGESLTRLLRVKLRHLAKFIAEYFQNPFQRWQRLGAIRQLRNSKIGSQALVLGLGPSLLKLNPYSVRSMQLGNHIEVFAVNAFALSETARHLTPDHYVLTDPAYFGSNQEHYKASSRASPEDVWQYLREHEEVNIFIPHNKRVPDYIDSTRVLHINALGLPGLISNLAPTRPRGYLAITAYSALAIAGWMKFDRILMIGIDNSQYRSMALSTNRRVAVGASHAYTSNDVQLNELKIFQEGGVAAYFEDVARLYGNLRLFRDLNIENLDQESLVDCFPLARDFAEFLHQECH